MHNTFLSYQELRESYMNEAQETRNILRQNILSGEDAVAIREAAAEARYARQSTIEQRRENYYNFSANVKQTLLEECIFKIFKESIDLPDQKDSDRMVQKRYVTSFVEEQGVENLLREFRKKTVLLSELAKLVTKHHAILMEGVSEDDETLSTDKEKVDDFLSELEDQDDIADIADTIKSRVGIAVGEFIEQNKNDKMQIHDILSDLTDKSQDETVDEEIRESYVHDIKKRVADVRSRRTNIFENMVLSISEAALKNKELGRLFMMDNKLNLDRIMESAVTMYTFLETLSTTKMVNVDESYIMSVYQDLQNS